MGWFKNQLIFKQKSQFQSPIDPASPFDRSVMKLKIAQRSSQAILMARSGPVPNRLPHDY
jgi:hypothetical protein